MASTTRTADQSEIARFWYPSVTFTFSRIARDVGTARGLDLWESARLFAILTTAHADSLIAVWDAKLAYDFWRPVTAIRAGDTDGNPDTVADPTWTSYMVNPPYPDFTSGHSAMDGSSAEVLGRFFGGDQANFSATTTLAPGPAITRSFTSFTQAAEEGAASRVYGGIHFRSACDDALQQGQNIGRQVILHFFKPVTGGK